MGHHVVGLLIAGHGLPLLDVPFVPDADTRRPRGEAPATQDLAKRDQVTLDVMNNLLPYVTSFSYSESRRTSWEGRMKSIFCPPQSWPHDRSLSGASHPPPGHSPDTPGY